MVRNLILSCILLVPFFAFSQNEVRNVSLGINAAPIFARNTVNHNFQFLGGLFTGEVSLHPAGKPEIGFTAFYGRAGNSGISLSLDTPPFIRKTKETFISYGTSVILKFYFLRKENLHPYFSVLLGVSGNTRKIETTDIYFTTTVDRASLVFNAGAGMGCSFRMQDRLFLDVRINVSETSFEGLTVLGDISPAIIFYPSLGIVRFIK